MNRSILYGMLLILGSSCSGRFTLPAQLEEVSGLYVQTPDSLWWHNDGGWPARLYCTDQKGKLIDSMDLPMIANVDWEDICADDSGHIYIGDFGNNRNKRRDLVIYQIDTRTRQLAQIEFHYPDQHQFPPPRDRYNFDLEAMVWYRDSLHLFSKNILHAGTYFTKHYVVPARPGQHEAILRDSLYLKKRVVTAAALSPDRQELALLSYTFKRVLGFLPWSRASVIYLSDFPDGHYLQGKVRRRRISNPLILATQYESLDYLNDRQLLIASEKTVFIRQRARQLRVR